MDVFMWVIAVIVALALLTAAYLWAAIKHYCAGNTRKSSVSLMVACAAIVGIGGMFAVLEASGVSLL